MTANDYSGPWPWPWKDFKPAEIACKHCAELWPGDGAMPEWFADSMTALQRLREAWESPIVLNSAHRCTSHNKAVGGTASSQHLRIAFDCRCPASEQGEFAKAAKQAGFTGIGLYPGKGFVHLDLGPARQWRG